MRTVRSLFSVTTLGSMVVLVMGCASPKGVGEPEVDTASPPPVVDSAPTESPPGYIAPTNYWVREKIILTSESEPSAPQKSPVKKGKKGNKTGKQ
jgi:hypothetical protein